MLTGATDSGKTALIHKLCSENKGILYIDLRHFFDSNAFVFEMIDSLYDQPSAGWSGKFVGTYVKLFCFVTALMAQGNQDTTALMYFHAMLRNLFIFKYAFFFCVYFFMFVGFAIIIFLCCFFVFFCPQKIKIKSVKKLAKLRKVCMYKHNTTHKKKKYKNNFFFWKG